MKALTLVFCCLALAVSLYAASGGADAVIHGRGNPGGLDQQWGPDTYGYRAKDTAAPGGPPAQWVDISAIGTEVIGLTDDNIVGPFSIGWSFHYYWYDVVDFWVGSNGYIKFSTPGQLAQPIPNLPNQAVPNDVVAPYAADWFFGPSEASQCFRWSNGTDTLIVMWKNVVAWLQTGNTGNHNFELILARVDSSITFQYGVQQDTVSNNNIVVGIEDVTGRLGISCLFGTYPPSNYAIQFAYPDTVTYVAHDAATAAVLNATSGGIFIRTGDTLAPWMAVRNAGNQPESGIHVRYSVRNSGNTLLAMDSTTLTRIVDPMMVVQIPFAPLWRAGNPAVFKAVGRVFMAGDAYAGNDSIRAEIHTMNLPGEMFYDDGSSNREWSWAGGNGGMGMQFVPPVYPVEITRLRFYVVTGIADGFDATIYDDDGPLGSPGTLLQLIHVANPTTGAWASVDVPAGTIINDGSFYVAWMQTVEGITFGVDTTSSPGISRRSWEYAGGWAENRLNQEADCMIRCSIRQYVAPNDPPGAFERIAPADSVMDPWGPHVGIVTLSWHRSVDPNGDPVTYHFQFYSPTYPIVDTNVVVSDTTYAVQIPIPTTQLDEVHNFYWRVWARDGHDSTEASNGRGIFFLDIPESAENPDPALVREFALSAYPNPFNPLATLHYAVPKASLIELKIFNIVGEQVAVLKHGFMEPGRYRLQWNAADLPTGTYFAVLKSGSTTKIQKLLLLK